MYTVQGIKFESFEALVQHVWDQHKISWEGGDWEYLSESDKQSACLALDEVLKELA